MSSKYKGWYHETGSDTTIVFIHGLFSDSEKCWSNTKKKTFWPDLIKDDTRFGNPNIFMAEFYTDVSSGDYKVTDCSNEVHRAMSIKGEVSGLSVLDQQNIIFVGHSTGGIVLRHLIESKQDLFTNKNIGIALYASPSFGSKLATSFSVLSRLFKNKLAQELNWGSTLLEDLDDRFRNLLESKKLCIVGYEAFENKPPFMFMPKVVSKQSAGRYFSAPQNIANTDHSSIVKPSSKSADSHEALVLFIQENSSLFIKKKFKNKKNIVPLSLLVDKEEGVLFEFYNPRNEKYYIEREFDKDILRAMSNNHLWLCGPTGIGKTVALQRAIYKYKAEFKYISLSSCIKESIDYMLTEILLCLSPDHEIKEESTSYYLKTIAIILKSHCANKPLVLFIEEIPINNQEMFNDFSRVIYTIIISMKPICNFKLILSSIYKPADISGTEFEKITENFQIIKGTYWLESDLIKLIEMIKKNIEININIDFKHNDFEATPRETKIYYRDFLVQNKSLI